MKKELIVVGDRVLVEPEAGEERTHVGLYLPQTAVDSRAVQGGRVVALGPGVPVGPLETADDEPWKRLRREPRYLPMQARVGDYALFFRKASVDITFEGKNYFVVPHDAILVIVRETPDGDSP
ncbi:MAG TPA: co-chaperone GroES family protein [Candidatus Krumholzibacteria bacterium]|nr:co-chaperone GroES family protein [Candidatus Krumholzibacteria bacterium]